MLIQIVNQIKENFDEYCLFFFKAIVDMVSNPGCLFHLTNR